MIPLAPYASSIDSTIQQTLRHTRLLAYLVVSTVIAAGVVSGYYPPARLFCILFLVAYPLLVQWAEPKLEEMFQGRHSYLLMLADSLITGLSIAATQFSVVPALMFLLMLNAAVLIQGSVQTWATCMVFVFIGMLSGLVPFGVHFAAASAPAPVLVTACLGAIGYISLAAFYIQRQQHELLSAKNQVLQQQEHAIQVSRKLIKYLPPQIWESIFSGKRDVKLQTHRKKLTIFFSDIKDFTETTDEMSPDALTDMLNFYFDQMSKIALRYGGTIDKFIGDAILIFFGDPKSQGAKEDALACVSMAIEMRNVMKVLRQKWQSQGIQKPLHVRMGVTTGYCHVGNFGSESRMDYTIIGRDANLAARLQAAAQPDEILIAHETYLLVRDRIMCREKGLVTVKGINRPIQVWTVVDFRRDMGATASFMEYELDGFAMHMDVNKIKNYDKERIVQALEVATRKLKDKLIV